MEKFFRKEDGSLNKKNVIVSVAAVAGAWALTKYVIKPVIAKIKAKKAEAAQPQDTAAAE